MYQIQDQMTVFSCREGIFMYTYTLCCGQLRLNAIIIQHHFIVAGSCFFRGMAETGAVSFVRVIRPAGIQFQFTYGRHQ